MEPQAGGGHISASRFSKVTPHARAAGSILQQGSTNPPAGPLAPLSTSPAARWQQLPGSPPRPEPAAHPHRSPWPTGRLLEAGGVALRGWRVESCNHGAAAVGRAEPGRGVYHGSGGAGRTRARGRAAACACLVPQPALPPRTGMARSAPRGAHRLKGEGQQRGGGQHRQQTPCHARHPHTGTACSTACLACTAPARSNGGRTANPAVQTGGASL